VLLPTPVAPVAQSVKDARPFVIRTGHDETS
jgi:hypothetical protein